MVPSDTSMAEQIIRNKLVWLMTTKYALLTTKNKLLGVLALMMNQISQSNHSLI